MLLKKAGSRVPTGSCWDLLGAVGGLTVERLLVSVGDLQGKRDEWFRAARGEPPAQQGVVTGLANEDVTAGPAERVGFAGAAEQRVGAWVAVEPVVTLAAAQSVRFGGSLHVGAVATTSPPARVVTMSLPGTPQMLSCLPLPQIRSVPL